MNTMPSQRPVIGEEVARDHHVCPWWVGYLITNPIRKLGENPDRILPPLVSPGMTAVDIGCGMGFFSLPLARLVGDSGRVVCVDVQPKMLTSLARRAKRKGLSEIIEPRLATQGDLAIDDLEGQADLLLAVHVVHESAYPRAFLTACCDTLRPGGKLLILEPKGHVSNADFEVSLRMALEVGFTETGRAELLKSRSVVLEKKISG
jgi:2-polyprenyl-3-methyl-5-hydroxy-6-metoxy-1,4-benzoquinol methylase